MQSITENRPFFYSILMASAAVFTLVTRFAPDLCDQFEVVPFPAEVCPTKTPILGIVNLRLTECIFLSSSKLWC